MILTLARTTRRYVVFKEDDVDDAYILYMPKDDWMALDRPREVDIEPTVMQEREDLAD